VGPGVKPRRWAPLTRDTRQGVKGELGEFQIYFRKIPLHQQKLLVVLLFSNSPWLPRKGELERTETNKNFC